MKSTFKNLMQKLNIQTAETNQQRFDKWMRYRIKNIYCSTLEMEKAIEKIKN